MFKVGLKHVRIARLRLRVVVYFESLRGFGKGTLSHTLELNFINTINIKMFIPGLITEEGNLLYKQGFELEPRKYPKDFKFDAKSKLFLVKLTDLSRGISHNKEGDKETFIMYPFDFDEDKIDFEHAVLLSLLLFPMYTYNHKTKEINSDLYDQDEIYKDLKRFMILNE
jgi:hypothetical protein